MAFEDFSMSINLPGHYASEYARNIDLLLQQKDSRLSPYAITTSHVGDKAVQVDQIGSIEMQDVVSRFAPMGRVDAAVKRPWIFPISSDLPQLIDTFDKLKLLTDPQSAYVMNAVNAANRRRDKHMVNAFFADAKIGVSGGDTESFGTTLTSSGGQNVGVNVGGSASGLNVAKLLECANRFMQANVDIEAEGGIHVGLKAAQVTNLLNEIQVIGREFGEPVFNKDKILTGWWVFKFHHTELIQTGTDDQTGTSTAVPAWVKSGMELATWQSQVTDISQRKDLQGLPWQVYLMMTMGAARREKEKVIRIWCR